MEKHEPWGNPQELSGPKFPGRSLPVTYAFKTGLFTRSSRWDTGLARVSPFMLVCNIALTTQ